MRELILGIDTSNYTTSVALTDKNHNVIADIRRQLNVKKGERGLRQSEAFFQHIENLDELIPEVMSVVNQEKEKHDNEIIAVAASNRPRPLEDSYMPVFRAGTTIGKIIASSLNLPFYTFSHQEGHTEVCKVENEIPADERFAVFHLSGGTFEILSIPGYEIIGGSKDISLGQLIDRVGVKMGYDFPAGKALDEIAWKSAEGFKSSNVNSLGGKTTIKEIPVDDLYVNLSGIESQISRMVDDTADSTDEEVAETNEMLITEMFQHITRCLKTLTAQVKKKYNIEKVLLVGGVASSRYVREFFSAEGDDTIIFSRPESALDNAIGISYLGGNKAWH